MLRIHVLGGLYLTREGRALTGAAAQPRRLAVLALLTAAGARGVSRDRLIGYLWPDHDEDRARHALTQALYTLRRELGTEELFLGQQEVRLNPDVITSDCAEFREAIRANEPERAVARYGGPFLEGFHLPGEDTFARWVEEERELIAEEYGRALEAAARRATERQDPEAAVAYLKKRAAKDPLNTRVTLQLMEALAAQGDVVGALRQARVHEKLVRDELELPPDPEVSALAARLRASPRAPAPPPVHGAVRAPVAPGSRPESPSPSTGPQAGELGEAAPPAVPVPPSLRRSHSVPAAIAMIVLALAAVALWVSRRPGAPRPPDRTPVIAVGQISDYTGDRPGGLGRPLTDMLATNLARAAGLRVISTTRMLELVRQIEGTGDSAAAASAAARQAGAGELVDGSLYEVAPSRYRLDLRRVDLGSGAVVGAYRVEGADLFALVDSGTAGLVRDLGGVGPAGSLTDVATASVAAYQAYEEGLRRFHSGDLGSAEHRFHEALELDSGFAMAAFYYARATTSGSRSEVLDRMRRAVDLSHRAGDRERLVIQAEWARQNSSQALGPLADTLMTRYPEEIDGYYYAAQGAVLLGNFLQAEEPLRRIIALDSLGFRANGGRCHICEAYAGLTYIYAAVDSVRWVDQVVREWIRRQPGSADPWRALAAGYARRNQLPSALSALRIADSLEPTGGLSRRFLVSIRAALELYDETERLLRTEMEAAPPMDRRRAGWDLAVVLRQVGRLREALPLAHEHRMSIKERLLPGAAPYNALLEAQILFEMGNFRAAAALFDSIGVGQEGDIDASLRARDRIWAWAHEADARAQLGDTARLRFLADSMEVLGRSVVHGRDRRLHAHVRGLLARLRGRDEEAAGWFERAIESPVFGFTRSNYELADAYLRLGRPLDAIRILGPALRGGTVGSNLYVTRTDLQARLAEAFDAAGQIDSAAHYYRRVIRAWERADPQFAVRRDSMLRAEARLVARAPGRAGGAGQ